MRITMTKTCNGSDNGEPPKSYEVGETYDVSDRLASVFTGEGFAVLVQADEPEQEPAEEPDAKKPRRRKRK